MRVDLLGREISVAYVVVRLLALSTDHPENKAGNIAAAITPLCGSAAASL